MKKFTATLIAIIILSVSLLPVTAFAWETPSHALAASYDAENQTITVYYRLLDFAGTESGDFRLRYDSEKLEYVDYEATDMDNTLIEIGKPTDEPDNLAIQFIDLYHVEEEDCDEFGSATIAKINFKVTDKSATETVFIATSDYCYMDPESTEVKPERATLKIELGPDNVKKTTDDNFVFEEDEKTAADSAIKKVIVAAVITAVVFVARLVAVVIKYRKK